ncbi:multimerin-2 [Sorex araneus]|uniref:multimerin-2 n=1 Tax=Sorex araneus TaxID=42254 RepID=UPI002433AE2D|nr:multimerin-2 [Sorex araneus]
MILTLLLWLGTFPGWGLLGTWAQDPGTSFSESLSPPLPPEVWRAEAEDRGDPIGRNWCPYQKSRLVTFVAACKTEKFFVHSQQPCPQGAPDCQKVKVMYRVAQKPVYQVKQKVLASVAWRCCPGFSGPDCQLHDPTAIPELADPGDDFLEPWDRPVSFEPERQAPWQSTAPGDVQNDLDQEDDIPPAAWGALADNLEAVATEINQTEANQTAFGVPERPLEQALLLHVDSFLRQHFGPQWRSFNQSLHSLSEAVRNVSRELDAHQQALGQLQEGTVAKADLQELGAKFETKIQETAQKMDQLQENVEDRLHAQHLSVQASLSEMEKDVDAKFKKLLKAQESEGSLLLAAAAAGARPEPESLQARLGQLQRNLSALLVATSQREQELHVTLADMGATLAQHRDEIKELYNESDETFDQISRVERLVEELQVNHTALRELRIILMEKSLILEENKAELERQILELNLTLQHVQGGHTDLIKYVKGCNCQKLDLDADGIREGPKDTLRALEDEEEEEEEEQGESRVHPQDGSSLRALRGALDALSQAVDAQRADTSRAHVDLARLRSGLQALGREVSALQAAEGAVRREIGLLHSSFEALLDDALRHEAVLAALFGEEVMEAMNDEAPGPLPLSYEQIRVGLQEAASGLQEQAIGWDVLAERVTALEQAAGVGVGRARPLLPTAHLEPSHDASPEEASGTDLAGLAQELQRLSTDVKRVGLCCEAAGAAATNSSLEGLRQALSTAQRGWEQHQTLFHSLFGNFQGLLEANVSLDLGKLQAMLNRKGKKQKKGLEAPRRRDRREAEPWTDEQGRRPVLGTLGAKLWAAGSPVAFYTSLPKGTTALQTVKFNTTYLNIGSGYFPDTGYFQAPERGVYLFAVSLEFGAGPGAGQLVFGGHHRTPVRSLGGNTVTTFALAELQKGERVWFELTQGSIVKKNPSGTAFGGFLMFQT